MDFVQEFGLCTRTLDHAFILLHAHTQSHTAITSVEDPDPAYQVNPDPGF
jgi:hypothetical protein